MNRHRFKSGFGQCECRWCGKMRNFCGVAECRVTNEMRYALKLFARGNGRTWKTKLMDEWAKGGPGLSDNIRQPLMELRNVIGPRMLAKFKSHLLDDVTKEGKPNA